MIAGLTGLLLVAAWEWPHLRSWTAVERVVFWAAWVLCVAWVVLAMLHLGALNLIRAEDRLFQGLGKRWLTPTPDPFW